MKYILSQKLLAFGDDFVIEESRGKKIFTVDGKAFAIGEKLYFKDINNNVIFKIRKKLIKLTDTYEIQKDGETYATVRKEMFTVFNEKFEIKTPYGEIKAKGNFIDYDFSFRKDGKEIAEVSKKFISIRDKYVVTIDEFQDEALLLACVVVIDMICHHDCD
ncbi:MAG: LURP-one-related family protein [Terrisporobacter sp.]